MNISIGSIFNEGVATIAEYSGIIRNTVLLLLAVAFIVVVIKIIADLGDPNKK